MFLAAGGGKCLWQNKLGVTTSNPEASIRMNYCTDALLLHCLDMFVIVNELLTFGLSLVSRQSSPCRRPLGLPRSPMIMCVSSIAWWAAPSCLGSSACGLSWPSNGVIWIGLFCSWKALSSEGKLVSRIQKRQPIVIIFLNPWSLFCFGRHFLSKIFIQSYYIKHWY